MGRRHLFAGLGGLAAAASVLVTGTAALAARHPRPPADWRSIISDADRNRLHDWRLAWTMALDSASSGGAGRQIAAEGALLRPDTLLAGVAPDGLYRCRIIKIGAQQPGGLPFISYPGFRCRIDAGRFVKLDGSQRPAGRLYPLDATRTLFLGTMMLGDEANALPYGRDAERDMLGLLERVEPGRWRLVLPRPHWESLLDVIELVPLAR